MTRKQPQFDTLTDFANSFYDDWKDGGFTYLIAELCHSICLRNSFTLNTRESAFLRDFYFLADLIVDE